MNELTESNNNEDNSGNVPVISISLDSEAQTQYQQGYKQKSDNVYKLDTFWDDFKTNEDKDN